MIVPGPSHKIDKNLAQEARECENCGRPISMNKPLSRVHCGKCHSNIKAKRTRDLLRTSTKSREHDQFVLDTSHSEKTKKIYDFTLKKQAKKIAEIEEKNKDILGFIDYFTSDAPLNFPAPLEPNPQPNAQPNVQLLEQTRVELAIVNEAKLNLERQAAQQLMIHQQKEDQLRQMNEELKTREAIVQSKEKNPLSSRLLKQHHQPSDPMDIAEGGAPKR